MRFSGWSSLAISICSALVFIAPAAAHVTVVPQFLGTGDAATLSLTGPNERDEPMTGFAISVPRGFRLVAAHSPAGWSAIVQERRATWSGGSLPSGTEATFHVELEASSPPGPAELQVEQRYAGGEVVRWPIALTVTPSGGDEPSQNLGWGLVTGLVGLLVTVGVVVVGWVRRNRSLQEK